MTLGDRLKEIRKQKKLTLDEIASMTGVSKGTLSQIENGKVQPSTDNLIKICERLECSSDYLLLGIIKENHKEEVQKEMTLTGGSVDLVEKLVYFAELSIVSKNQAIEFKEETVKAKDQIIEIQENTKNELMKEKDEQIKLQREIIGYFNKRSIDN